MQQFWSFSYIAVEIQNLCLVKYAFRWRGNYGGNVQHWFPANYVEEISSTDEDSDASPLGSLQKGTIDLTGITVGKFVSD